MRSSLCFGTLAIVALAGNNFAQEAKKAAPQAQTTKATYMITGLHCPPCATTVEGSLRNARGIASIKVDYSGKQATVLFDERIISAQEVARAVSSTPHMMGSTMHYNGHLVLSVPGVKDEVTATKATTALSKVSGVANVTVFPEQEAVGISFSGAGKATTGELIQALAKAGLKGAQ
jgi:copper chaperone CopZ